MKQIVLKSAVTLYALMMVLAVAMMLVAALWGYGYYGYEDKSLLEMAAIRVEYLIDLVLIAGFLTISVLVWTTLNIGRSWVILTAGPGIVITWWLIQCRCLPTLPTDWFEYSVLGLSLGGAVFFSALEKHS